MAIIRPIETRDNNAVATCIRRVLLEFGVPKVGTAYEDASLEDMYASYSRPNAQYYVVEEHNRIIGGAGIAQLDNYDGKVCELQKMYFLPEARGRGIGSQMIQKCLDYAASVGYTTCYLETMPYMDAARALYFKNGFTAIEKPLGDTGHYNCSVYMTKELL